MINNSYKTNMYLDIFKNKIQEYIDIPIYYNHNLNPNSPYCMITFKQMRRLEKIKKYAVVIELKWIYDDCTPETINQFAKFLSIIAGRKILIVTNKQYYDLSCEGFFFTDIKVSDIKLGVINDQN